MCPGDTAICTGIRAGWWPWEIMAGVPLIQVGFVFSAAGSRGRTCWAVELIPLWQQCFLHLKSHLETAWEMWSWRGISWDPGAFSLSLWMWLWLLDCRISRDGQCSPWEEGSCVLSQFSIFPS